MLSILPSVLALGPAALVAMALALHYRSPPGNEGERHAAARALALAVTVQFLHFTEETVTGFHESFPALFDLPALPLSLFIAFNLAWIAIWIVSIRPLRSNRRFAFFAAWFLSIAGILNAIAHPLMALAVRGYFPGLVSSPFIGGVCLVLWHRLQKASGMNSDPPNSFLLISLSFLSYAGSTDGRFGLKVR